MDYSKIRVPFVGSSIINKKADFFRGQYWDSKIPVDIEKIISVKLKIDIFPIPDMMDQCNTDVLLLSDWESIYVDYKMYYDERFQNRLRFSYAHEIGHFVLHKEIYKSFNISSYEDYIKYISYIPQEQYSKLETQANMFANHLLISREKLKKELNKEMARSKELIQGDIDKDTLLPYLAIPLAKKFGVSEKPIIIALNCIVS